MKEGKDPEIPGKNRENKLKSPVDHGIMKH